MKKINKKGYVIRLSEQAVISLIMSAFEAYAVTNENKHKNCKHKNKLETFGHLFGQEIKLKDGETLYNIEYIHTDSTAKQETDSVTPNDDALTLKMDLVSSYWPHLSYIGDFHTHPDETIQDTEEVKNYHFSKEDRDCLVNNKESYESIGYRVGLVVAVSSLKRSGSKENDWHGKGENRIVITKGNLRIWIGAYVAKKESGKVSYTNDDDSKVALDIPCLLGLWYEHAKFGRIKKGKYQSNERVSRIGKLEER